MKMASRSRWVDLLSVRGGAKPNREPRRDRKDRPRDGEGSGYKGSGTGRPARAKRDDRKPPRRD